MPRLIGREKGRSGGDILRLLKFSLRNGPFEFLPNLLRRNTLMSGPCLDDPLQHRSLNDARMDGVAANIRATSRAIKCYGLRKLQNGRLACAVCGKIRSPADSGDRRYVDNGTAP